MVPPFVSKVHRSTSFEEPVMRVKKVRMIVGIVLPLFAVFTSATGTAIASRKPNSGDEP